MKNQGRIRHCYRDQGATLSPNKRRKCGAKFLSPVKSFFDFLTEDLILFILSKLSSSANSPSDLINVLLTCRRFKKMVTNPTILSQISTNGLRLNPLYWNNSAEKFLKKCTEAGNLEACYLLGMIYFYCFNRRKKGKFLLTKAESKSHPEALYSLAVINFNGSGGSGKSKDESKAIKLCTLAANSGHINGHWELIHRLMSGYGVSQDIEGAHELIKRISKLIKNRKNELSELHPANQFMVEWFQLRGRCKSKKDLRICSHKGCGRIETRPREFWRCFSCRYNSYCSLACEAISWKERHKEKCSLMEWLRRGRDGFLPDAISLVMVSLGY